MKRFAFALALKGVSAADLPQSAFPDLRGTWTGKGRSVVYGANNTLQIRATGNSGGTIDFEADATNRVYGFTNVSGLTFVSSSGISTAVFSSNQFDNGKISSSSLITGSSGGTNNLVVNPMDDTSFSMANWTFSGWTGGTDTITVNDSSGDDTIMGSSQSDILNGGAGDDVMARVAPTS
jgi:hypothetical protein